MGQKKERAGFFEVEEAWEAEWEGMPEFAQEDLTSWKAITVHFANEADMKAFAELTGQNITKYTRSIWYPKAEIWHMVDKRYADES